jgi:adhesin transport system outer membrane protein
MNKNAINALAALSCLGVCLSAPLQAEPLKDVIENVVKTNPDVLATTNHRRSADNEVRVAKGGYFPKVDVTLGYGRERTDNPYTRSAGFDNVTLTRREAEITLRQMLFDGFGVGSEVDRQKARLNSSAFLAYGTSEEISLNAVEAYIEVLRQQDLVALARQNMQNHQRTYDQIQMRSDSGVGRKADQEQAQGRLSLAKSNLLAAESDLKDSETQYLYVTGNAPNSLVKPELPEQLLPKTEAEAVEMAVGNHPILKSALADVEAAQAQHQAAKSLLYPRLDIELSAARDKNLSGVEGENNNRQAMLRLRYNLFEGKSDSARVDQTSLLTQEATEISNRTRRQVEQATKMSWNAYTSARARLAHLKDFMTSSESTREAYGKQFNLGQRTLLDLLDSENEYFTASSSYVTGQYTQLFAAFRLLQNEGRLLEALGVPLPEEAMSPSDEKSKPN